MNEINVMRLSEEQMSELNIIMTLVTKYKTSDSPDEKNELIKMISSKHVILKSHLTKSTKKFRHPEDLKLVKDIEKKVIEILYPVYGGLLEMAIEHLHEWYKQIMYKKGMPNPKLYKYQIKLMRYMLKACIYNKHSDFFYSLLVSRGGGKSYSLSILSTFLLLFHERYILYNSNFSDYIILLSSPTEKQLHAFKTNIHEFLKLCMSTDDEVGYIGTKQSEESILGLWVSKNAIGEIQISRDNGSIYSGISLATAGNSFEGRHGNLLILDEAKFTSTIAVNQNLAPTIGARNGVFLQISSASKDYCQFQDLVYKNIRNDIEVCEELGLDLEYDTWDGRKINKDRPENVKQICGEFTFIQHWSSMIADNHNYALTISRAIETSGEESEAFQTQYENKFLSSKSSSFFDIKDLKSNYKTMFQDENDYKYLDNPKYFLVAGLDVAVTGDFSRFYVKAFESGYGENRKSKLLYMYTLNPTKDKNVDNLLSQCETVVELIKKHNLKALAIDESGVGKSAKNYIVNMLLKERYIGIDPKNIFDIVFTSANRNTILEYYYNRLQSGLEILRHIPKEWEDEDYLKRLYVNNVKGLEEKSQWISFVFEHMKFTRTDIKDEKTGQVKTIYIQSSESFMFDDTIFGSALCSIVINKNPTLTATTTNSSYSNKGRFGNNRFSRK